MQVQAQKIYKHFGEEMQQLVAQEEYHELQVALHELAKFNIKLKRKEYDNCMTTCLVMKNLELERNCNEEFADNVLMCMQILDCDFDDAFQKLIYQYNKSNIKHIWGIQDFYFTKKTVEKVVKEKINRTIKKYGIEV